MRVPQFVMMCSTYPICSGVSNGSNNEPGATNTSDSNIPGIFNLDVGDTNWVITSSFIIFTMQTGDTLLRAGWSNRQNAAIFWRNANLYPLSPSPLLKTSCQLALRSILWPRRSSGGYSLASHRISPGSIPGQFMWFSDYFRFSCPTFVNLESSYEITEVEDLWIEMRKSRATGMWTLAALFFHLLMFIFEKKILNLTSDISLL